MHGLHFSNKIVNADTPRPDGSFQPRCCSDFALHTVRCVSRSLIKKGHGFTGCFFVKFKVSEKTWGTVEVCF